MSRLLVLLVFANHSWTLASSKKIDSSQIKAFYQMTYLEDRKLLTVSAQFTVESETGPISVRLSDPSRVVVDGEEMTAFLNFEGRLVYKRDFREIEPAQIHRSYFINYYDDRGKLYSHSVPMIGAISATALWSGSEGLGLNVKWLLEGEFSAHESVRLVIRHSNGTMGTSESINANSGVISVSAGRLKRLKGQEISYYVCRVREIAVLPSSGGGSLKVEYCSASQVILLPGSGR